MDGVTYYFVDNVEYYYRDGVYGYDDDAERFSFFCRAVLNCLPAIDFFPDVINANDWHAGLLPVLLKLEHNGDERYEKIKTIYTIHNLKYQGVFPKDVMSDVLGLDWKYFNNGDLEFYDAVNFMKGGIIYADYVSTVSKTYAQEIQYEYFGEHLDGLLRSRKDDLYGIVNGIDYNVYNPATDKNLFVNYDNSDAFSAFERKGDNKIKLQELLGLPQDRKIPMVSMVTRLVAAKGLDLVVRMMDELLQHEDFQFVLLGTGDKVCFAWEYRKPDKAINVKFNGNAYMQEQPDGSLKLVHENAMTVMAVPYDVPIVGYHNKTVNTLRLWNAEVNRDFSDYGMLTHEQMRAKNDYRNFVESITQYLYPDDSSNDGRRMRLIQEYFMVSAGVQSIVRHFVKAGMNIREFDKKVAIHINDTHPALCVAELMRLFVDEYGLEWNEAWTITRGTVAYTNHTIMPEALETWPVDMFKALLPRIYMIIEEINRRHVEYIRARYPDNIEKLRAMSIIENGLVHMARLSIVGSHSVNGVARIHSDILKSTTLHDFYEYWPRMFNNKTNGITHRRWLMGANPELAELIDRTIGSRIWHRHPEQLDLLNEAVDDRKVLNALEEIKHIRKVALAKYVKKHQGIEVNPDTIFDIQVKRIHSARRAQV